MSAGVNNNKTTTSWFHLVGNVFQDGRVIALTSMLGIAALGYFGYNHQLIPQMGVGGGLLLLTGAGMVLRLRSWINENHPAPVETTHKKPKAKVIDQPPPPSGPEDVPPEKNTLPKSEVIRRENLFSDHLKNVYAGFSKLNKS